MLQQLLDAPFVQLLGVADLDLNQPGIALARARGVPVTTRFMDLVDAAVDIIIDVTGSPRCASRCAARWWRPATRTR
ncbi:hypothetical protein ACHFCA_20515 [Delftia tsuruhatensis]